MTEDWEEPRAASRGGRVIAAVGSAAVVAILLAGRVLPPADEPLPTPAPAPAPDPERAVSTTPALGSWRMLADAPLRPRTDHLAVWSGREMIVWGGVTADGRPLTDGAAYDPAGDSWRRIPSWWGHIGWPVTAVWLGEEMAVVGEQAIGAYHPGHDRWRWLPSPPEGQWAWQSAGVGAGELILLSHSAYGDAPRRAVAYLPKANAWRELPAPPLDGWEGSAAVTLDGAYVATGVLELGTPAIALLEGDDRWTPAHPAPTTERWLPQIVADRTRVVVAGPQGELLAWSLSYGWDERVPDMPPPLARRPAHLASDGSLIAWVGDTPANGMVLARGRWQPMAEAPLDGRQGASGVWTGTELLVWGGATANEQFNDGAGFRLDELGWAHAPVPAGTPVLDGTWRQLSSPPLVRDRPSLVWTGTELLVWGGAEGRPANTGAAYDPASDAWSLIPDAPLRRRLLHEAVWTGSEMIIWGGVTPSNAVNDGAAYDPEADDWRSLPAAPVEQLGVTLAALTPEGMAVVTGPADKVAAVYHPDSDRWRRLPDLPRAGHLTGVASTGSELIVVTDAVDHSVLRFDGRGWRPGASLDARRPSSGMEAAWTGREIIVWGGADDVPRLAGFAYDPGTDTWRQLPTPWFAGSLTGAGAAWTGTHVVLSGHTEAGRAFGAYHPDEDRWHALPTPPTGPLLDGPMVWTGEELVVWSMHGGPVAFRPH